MMKYRRPDCSAILASAIRLGAEMANYECRLEDGGILVVQKLVSNYESYTINSYGDCDCPSHGYRHTRCKHMVIGPILQAYFTCPVCSGVPVLVMIRDQWHLICSRCSMRGMASASFQTEWLGRALTKQEFVMARLYELGASQLASAHLALEYGLTEEVR